MTSVNETNAAIRERKRIQKQFKDDPVFFFKVFFGVVLTDTQKSVLLDITNNK